jgi:hypothetical protein
MKQQFTEKIGLSKNNEQKLFTINEILEDYKKQGYKLTLRQLYYQLVSKNIIPNKKDEYGKLSVILKKGRMFGVVDWAAIEDRVRVPKLPYYVHDIDDAINDTINGYRLNRMKGQEKKIEIWVEKDALSNVLYRATSKYGVRLMVNRGYSSVSAMYDAHQRMSDGDIILYFGDHDPSGLDMIRDIKQRMQDFWLDINVIPIALTMQQIRKYNPPKNPAKVSDPRAKWYIKEFGESSWELDALPPKVLNKLAEDAILENIDLSLYEEQLDREKRDIKKLRKLLK